MRRFITGSLELFCNIAIFLILVVSIASGVSGGGIAGSVVGFVAGVVTSVVVFGGLFLLMDIADNSRRAVELLEKRAP